MDEVSDHDWSNAKLNYVSYLNDAIKIAGDNNTKNEKENLYTGNDKVYFPRDGGCRIDQSSKESINLLLDTYKSTPALIEKKEVKEVSTNIDGLYKTDTEVIVNGQDDLCEYIYKKSIINSGKKNNEICYKLSVDYVNKYGKNNYTVGFVRKISSEPAVSKKVNIYELTWNPATRWLKESFNSSEGISEKSGAYILNQELKSTVVNTAIADAIAYLSDSGVLVNYDLLQAFCLAYLGSHSSSFEYNFHCSSDLLNRKVADFHLNNEVILISHSLGTRIVLDTLGLLSKDISEESSFGLISHIHKKFEIIGAEVPDGYLSKTDANGIGFYESLIESIPDFINSIGTLYVFTNQIPLLAANISSPFKEKNHEIGAEFSNFLEMRDRRLRIVSFHDPDDLLSYDLKCWYKNNILKELETTKELIELQAIANVADNGSEIGDERKKIRDAIFGVCKEEELKTKTDKTLYGSIWEKSEEKLELINVGVRLESDWNIPWTFSDPYGIHSNYFTDKSIHDSFIK
ncbi:hypothetical protein DV711_00890 [Motiliproteus coralliicola]|uniref:Alpha/beta hydrolase n=2 Tax=Motiliproteus coralliicola TaxID=2283196 RepID=A0A369WUG9_9GAMM|nr:hypothetical protein DV711_00890 [Motiliproteus coralliicola]